MHKISEPVVIWAVCCLSLMAACSPKNEVDRKVESLLSGVTLQEKIGQMNQLSGGPYLADQVDFFSHAGCVP